MRDTILPRLRAEFPRCRFDVKREINDFAIRWRVWLDGRPMKTIISPESVQDLKAVHGIDAEEVVLQAVVDQVRFELKRGRWYNQLRRKLVKLFRRRK